MTTRLYCGIIIYTNRIKLEKEISQRTILHSRHFGVFLIMVLMTRKIFNFLVNAADGQAGLYYRQQWGRLPWMHMEKQSR
jgi:hypothetical protein